MTYNPKRTWRVQFTKETSAGTDVFEIEVTAHALWVAACRAQRMAGVDARALIHIEETTNDGSTEGRMEAR